MGASPPLPRVDDYLVQGRLGEGGMGAVYRVVHAPTGAVRALKIVSVDDRQHALRFQREAEAMAAVGPHEHLLPIHAAGQAPGFAWFVMDLATGGDLADRLRKGRLPTAEVVRVGVGVARGLAHLHARGLLHRDVKPSNVLFDERGAPRLADFGLVRRLDDSQTRLTETGVILGTPAYLAPEQVTGQGELDARVDVYALGMLLFEAATGSYPFDAASGALDLLAQITRRPPPSPRALAPDLPPALEAVILRCLEKEPAARPASALEVAAALEAALAPPPAPPARRVVWPLGAAAGVVTATGLALALVGAPAPVAVDAPPEVAGAPAPTDPAALEAEVGRLLAREALPDADQALTAAWRADPAGVPGEALVALLVAVDDPALGRAWSSRAPESAPVRDALAAAAALDDALAGRGPEAGARAARGAVEVARAAALVRDDAARWRAEGYGTHPVEVLPAYERLVASASGAPGATGLALRLRVQRKVLAFDSALMRLAVRARREEARRLRRLLEAARALAPETAAAEALRVVDRWAAARHGEREPAAAPLATPLAGRYAAQEVTRQALDVLEGDLRAGLGELEARLSAWERACAAARGLGLVDAGGRLVREVSYEGAMRLEHLLQAQERRAWLLCRRAYLSRGGAADATAWAEAIEAAAAFDDHTGEGAEALVVARLGAGDAPGARAALGRVTREARRAELEVEVLLLEGDLERARALLSSTGQGQAARCQRAVVRALGGEDVTGDLAALRGEAQEPAWIPWRAVDATAHAVAAARRGWRPWTARLPWP